MKRVVVTGMGMVSPLGGDIPRVFDQVIAGQSGVVRDTRFDEVADLAARICAP